MASIRFTRNADYDSSNSVDGGLTGQYRGTNISYTFSVLRSSDQFNDNFQFSSSPNSASFFFDGERRINYKSTNAGVFVDLSDNTAAVNLTGGNFGDVLRGGSAGDRLSGGGGNDVLEGGGGGDRLDGGAGLNTLSYERSTEAVSVSLVDNSASGGDAEGDTLTAGTFRNIIGGLGGDVLYGDDNSNSFIGGSGADLIKGAGGADVLDGGAGADTLAGGDGFTDDAVDTVTYASSSAGVAVDLANSDNNSGGDAQGDVLNGIENLIGSAFADSLTGNDLANVLDGGSGGADSLFGGLGDDTYIVSHDGVTITEAADAGTDTVLSAVSATLSANVENLVLTGRADIDGTGNALANAIIGNAGGNVLDGGAGIDRVEGGAGDDTYVLDNAGDVVVEFADQGSDTVRAAFSYVLGDNVENLTLTGSANLNGTGDAEANVLIGNTGRNVLTGGAGNDTLDGGGGSDRLLGGLGDDTYVINAAGAAVIEAANEGTDTVRAAGNYVLGANLENLELTGTGGNGSGNALANTIIGNAGNNVLDGRAGADFLVGGAGNDTYVVDNADDVVFEQTNEGTDTVRASVSYALDNNTERLELTGASNLIGVGNDSANTIIGSTGSNLIAGLGGRDTLTGGAGRDTFAFVDLSDSTVAAGGRDTITDFTRADVDRIDLRNIDANSILDGDQAFGFLGAGAFTGTAGQLRYEASGANTLVTGDVDGNGAADFAILLIGQIALQRSDFLL